MRHTLFVILLAAAASGQSLIENAGAAAGGTAGGVAGKKVSDGVNSILGKVDKQTKGAAQPKTPDAMFEVGPGVPKEDQGAGSVPPPPPRARRAKTAPATVAEVPHAVVPPAPVAPPPPPPVVTAEELKTVAVGADRADVLKLGTPTSKITMFDDGHLVEIYRYNAHDATVGVVRLIDGTVSSVQMQ